MPMIALAIAVTVASTAYSVYSTVQAGKAQQKALEAQGRAAKEVGLANQEVSESEAQLADFNARIAELQAVDAEQRGEWDANRMREEVGQVIGKQRAGFAAGNIDVGFGSTVDTQADAAYLGELDVLQIKTNAAREAWGFRVEAYDTQQRAAIARLEGKNAARVGELGYQQGYAAGKSASSLAKTQAVGTVLNTSQSLLLQRYPASNWGRG